MHERTDPPTADAIRPFIAPANNDPTDLRYLIVSPLNVGKHTIHFQGAIPDQSFTWTLLTASFALEIAPIGQ
jgi:hypothetical protein